MFILFKISVTELSGSLFPVPIARKHHRQKGSGNHQGNASTGERGNMFAQNQHRQHHAEYRLQRGKDAGHIADTLFMPSFHSQ